MQVLSLLNRALPDRRRLSLAPWRAARALRAVSALARRHGVALARALLVALLRRVTRLVAGVPEPPAHHRRPTPVAALPLTTVVTVRPKREEPAPDVGALLSRVRGTRNERERTAALNQTLVDLERVIGLLRSMGLPPAESEGIERTYSQIQHLADPDTEGTGFELNMAWLLLERELRTVANRLAA